MYAVEQTYGFHQEPEYPKLHMEIPDDLAPAEKLLAPGGPADDEPVLKILAYHPSIDPDDFLATARLAVGDRAAVTRSSPSALLEISGPGVSKASTLALCCAERGISPRRSSPSGTCRTTSRCSPGRAGRTPWATRIRTSSRRPPAGPCANNEDGVAVVIERLLAERL